MTWLGTAESDSFTYAVNYAATFLRSWESSFKQKLLWRATKVLKEWNLELLLSLTQSHSPVQLIEANMSLKVKVVKFPEVQKKCLNLNSIWSLKFEWKNLKFKYESGRFEFEEVIQSRKKENLKKLGKSFVKMLNWKTNRCNTRLTTRKN